MSTVRDGYYRASTQDPVIVPEDSLFASLPNDLNELSQEKDSLDSAEVRQTARSRSKLQISSFVKRLQGQPEALLRMRPAVGDSQMSSQDKDRLVQTAISANQDSRLEKV